VHFPFRGCVRALSKLEVVRSYLYKNIKYKRSLSSLGRSKNNINTNLQGFQRGTSDPAKARVLTYTVEYKHMS